MEFEYCKLEIFVPESHLEAVRKALRETDAGHIGKYDSCLSYSPVTSCWRPLEGTNPYLGSVGEVCTRARRRAPRAPLRRTRHQRHPPVENGACVNGRGRPSGRPFFSAKSPHTSGH